MQLEFRPLHPTFAAEVSPVDLRSVRDPEILEAIREGMDRFAVLVFRDQPFTDEEQLRFARRLDGALHTKTGVRVLGKNRLGTDAFADISNVDGRGAVLPPGSHLGWTQGGNPYQRGESRPGVSVPVPDSRPRRRLRPSGFPVRSDRRFPGAETTLRHRGPR